MARHDLHRMNDSGSLVVVVQSDLLGALASVVVAPLIALDGTGQGASGYRPASRLNPVFAVEGRPHALATEFLAAVPVAVLGPRLGSLAHEADAITAALDMLFSGF